MRVQLLVILFFANTILVRNARIGRNTAVERFVCAFFLLINFLNYINYLDSLDEMLQNVSLTNQNKEICYLKHL